MSFPSFRTPSSRSARRPWRSAAAATAIAALALVGCSAADTPAGGADTATIQLGWIANTENMGPYVALEEGYYDDEGVQASIVPGGPSVAVEPLVVSGKALVGLTSADIAARAILAGAPLKIVAASLQTNPTSILSLAEAPVRTLEDIEGKRLCVQTSGMEIIRTVFASNGVDLDSVEFVSSDFDPSPLVTGQCDAFMSFLNNQPITLAAQGIETVNFPLSGYGYNVVSDAFVVSDATLADPAEREKVIKLIRATAKGWNTALADTDAAAELMVDKYGKNQNLDLEQQKLAAKTYVALVRTDDTAQHGLLALSDATVTGNIDTLNALGVDITADQIFDTSLVREAKTVN